MRPLIAAGSQGIACALAAALLFGASTPLAKLLLHQANPAVLAGLLYLGSGLGLLAIFSARAWLQAPRPRERASLSRADWPWLLGAIAAGGVVGPLLLMAGLALTPASTAALMLNLEGVLTSLLAWAVFREHVDGRIASGMGLIVAAGLLLSWEQAPTIGPPWGALCIAGACLCWAIDNNLTRKVSGSDAVQIACIKGLVAGSVNLALALALGQSMPPMSTALLAGLVGLGGYGLSLVLFVLALRQLGTARTGAYFSAAPFAGAVLALLLLGELPGPAFWAAAVLMAAGLWLHLSERHEHEHQHVPEQHSHAHTHDLHHQHGHDFAWDGSEPHVHAHQHQAQSHSHAHTPDLHHRHTH
jgi:drug/metabolite transporter (DMT)-like permease